MKEIPLTQDKIALVDNEDFEKVSAIKWHAEKRGRTFYAAHAYRDCGKVMKLPMQRVIFGNAPRGMVIDHIDGNGLNNRKGNLRFVTLRHNAANIPLRGKKSKYMGVSWNSQQGKWVVKPLINGKIKQLGSFVNEIDAAKAYQDFLDRELVVVCSNHLQDSAPQTQSRCSSAGRATDS